MQEQYSTKQELLSSQNHENFSDSFSVIYYDWMTNPKGLNLSPLQASLHVYAVIYAVSRVATGFLSASTYALAERIGFSRSSIKRAIKNLLAQELIVCEAIVGNERTGMRLYRVNQTKINDAINCLNSSNFYENTQKSTKVGFQQSPDESTRVTMNLAPSTRANLDLARSTVNLARVSVNLAPEQAIVENSPTSSTSENSEKEQVDNGVKSDQIAYKESIINSNRKRIKTVAFPVDRLTSLKVKDADTLRKLVEAWHYSPLPDQFEKIIQGWTQLMDSGFSGEQIWRAFEAKRDCYFATSHEKKSEFGALWYWLQNDGKARAEMYQLGMRPHKKPVKKPYEVFRTKERCAEGNMVFWVTNGDLKEPHLIELSETASREEIISAALAEEKKSNPKNTDFWKSAGQK